MSQCMQFKRMLSALLALVMVFSLMPVHAFAAEADATLTASLAEAKSYIDGITINNSSNDPATVVKNFKTHFTWDNEKRENSKSYLFDWSYYNGVVFEGIEYVYEVTGESVYKDYVVEYMSSLITSSGGWATCTNSGYTSKQCAGYNSTHGADCYKTASLLLDTYEMTGDSRYLTMAATLYADLDSAANSYLLANAGKNYRHTWASDPSPDLWLDGLYMILPFRAEYAKYIGDTEELDLIVSRMQWVSDNMYNSSKGLFYHAADSASSNSGTYWLRSIGWYAAAIVDIMDSMEGENLEAMKSQLVKLVDGMKACQNSSNGMWLNNMNASQSSSNPYETSGTALTCYAVMKAVNNGWLDESYADMAILAFNGICNEKLSGSTLTDICFKGAPGSSNSTFYDNEGKGVGPFIMFYAEMLEYVNKAEQEPEETVPETTVPETTVPETTVPETTVPETTVPEETEPEVTEPEVTEPEEEETVLQGIGNLEADFVYTLDSDGINSGEKYLIVYSGRALQNNNGVDNNPTVTISNNTITLSDDSTLAWTITQSSGNNYYVENNGSYLNLSSSGNDPIGSSKTVYITRSSSKYTFRNASGNGAYLRYSNSQLFCAGTNSSNNGMYLYRRTGSGTGAEVVFSIAAVNSAVKPGETVTLSGTVTVGGSSVDLSSCTITWSSSNTSVATVSGGTVTGVAGGDVNITATLSAVNGTALKENIVLTVPVTIQGHDYTSVVTAPTCENAGYTTHTCTICGESYVDSYTDALGHTYTGVVTAPDCENAGYTTYTCSVCGDSYVSDETAALGHDYETVTVEPTCTETGSVTYTCACGESYTETIDALGHSYEAVITAPTCTGEGFTTYTCTACGDSYVSDAVAALGHDYETVTVEPTCTETGSVTYTCACGESYTETIDALGHSYEAVITAPTCTGEGFTTYTCTACGDSYATDYTAALGHDYEITVVDPTCTENGAVIHTCACGYSYSESIDALGHDYESVVTAPNCENVGYTTNTCANCGDSFLSDEVAALGHDYESVTVEPTCTEAGSITYTCHCGDSYSESIDALGHDYESVVTAPDCINSGYTTNICAVCGDSYISDEVAARGHDYESVTVEPTCTETGSVTYTCACGESYTETVNALGHDYESVVTAPDCVNGGYTTNTCTVCGESFVADEVAALGHVYENVTVDATCENAGSITYTCHCGESYTETVDALGHDYESVLTAPDCVHGGYTTNTCARCGDSFVSDEVAALGHSYESVVTAPDCVNGGYTTNTCSVCGDSFVSDEVAALGHSYESVVTAPDCVNGGYTTNTCSVCGDSFVSDEVAALGHSYESVITAPDCVHGGYTTNTCSVCGDSFISDETAALGHSYESVVTAPDCVNGGYTTNTCVLCGDSFVSDEVAALGHSYSCQEGSGCLIYTCDHCGDSYTENVAWISLGGRYVLDTDGIDVGENHKYIVVGVDKNYALTVSGTTVGAAAVTVADNAIVLEDASNYEFYFVNNSSVESGTYLLTKDGSKYVYHMGGDMYYGTDNKGYWYFGSSSNGSYQIYDYDNLNWYLNYGYVWASDSVSRFAVSSNARYVRLFKATDSYARLSGETIQSYAHEAGATVSSVLGQLTIQLSTDGSNVTGTQTVTADMVTWDTAFDGVTAGTYTGTVTYQGAVLGTVTVTVTGEHTYESVTVAATCETAGSTTHTCTACGYSYVENETAALGHSYSCVESDGYLVYTCGRCGDSYSEKAESFTRVTSISAGNSYVITMYSGGSYYALSHAGNSISLVQVSVSGGEITSEVTDDMLWNYSSSKLSYTSGSTTYYMYTYSSGWGGWWGSWWGSPTLSLSTSNSSSVSFSSSKLKVGSYYLNYSNGSVSASSSSSTTYMFVQE